MRLLIAMCLLATGCSNISPKQAPPPDDSISEQLKDLHRKLEISRKWQELNKDASDAYVNCATHVMPLSECKKQIVLLELREEKLKKEMEDAQGKP